ncbi:sulfite exporter TauE/SafE family protein [Desulfocurvus sp. DL9XJH121]
MLATFLLSVAVGAAAGILAGLFGIGGGIVIVPLLVYSFTYQAVNPHVVIHLAVGTSIASILFTSMSSFLAHNRRGAVDWPVVRALTPGLVAGSVLGGYAGAHMAARWVVGIFAAFLFWVAVRMMLKDATDGCRALPRGRGLAGVGLGIGAVANLVGIGGGTLAVPFLSWCHVPMRRAVGISSAVCLPVAATGVVVNVLGGLGVAGRPDWSLGYVYLPAFFGIVAAGAATAPLGARMAHSLPVGRLRMGFGALLALVALKMAWGLAL